MKKIDVVKAVGGIVISVGVGTIVGNAIKATTPADVSAIKKVLIGLGSLVITGIASDMATNYTDKKINETVEQIKGVIETEEESE